MSGSSSARSRRYGLFSVLFLLAVTTVYLYGCACPKQVGPLDTNRPSASTSSGIVPPCRIQLEAGLSHTRNDDAPEVFRTDAFLESQLRIGVIPDTEVFLGYDGYKWKRLHPGEDMRGSGQPNIGFKYRFLEESGWIPESAFQGQLSLPFGGKDFRTRRLDPSFLFAFSHRITDIFSFTSNLGMAWQTEQDAFSNLHTLSVVKYTALLGFGITDRLGGYVEFYGDTGLSASSTPANSCDAGFTYLLLPNLQLDLYGGKGVSQIASDWILGAGISFRFPD